MQENAHKASLLALKEKQIEKGGGEKAVANIHASGRLRARERIDLLFDKDTFVEIDNEASSGMAQSCYMPTLRQQSRK